jgi:hypothetical protein
MFRPSLGIIRKITVGDVKDGFMFSVGQSLSINGTQTKISSIVRSEDSAFLFGNITYIIYISINNQDVVWKFFEGQPVLCECSVE